MRKFLPLVLDWLVSWFTKKKEVPQEVPDEPRIDLYMPEERLIFFYYDGSEKLRSADPMRLHRKFMDVRPDILTDFKVSQSEHSDARKCHERMIKTIHGVFDTKPYDEGGLTDGEAEDLLWSFIDYCNAVKKNPQDSPTSVAATSSDTPPSSSLPEEAYPATPATSASGSTAQEPSTARPLPWPKGVVSDSE